eukprot:3120957-Pleurochrysis_carterae.AAC.1
MNEQIGSTWTHVDVRAYARHAKLLVHTQISTRALRVHEQAGMCALKRERTRVACAQPHMHPVSLRACMCV